MQLSLLPPSATDVVPSSAPVTQLIKVSNPTKVRSPHALHICLFLSLLALSSALRATVYLQQKLRLRVKVNYVLNEVPQQEMIEVNNLPPIPGW